MSATYLGTDNKSVYFLRIISEECSSLGMDKKPSDIPIGCSLVAVHVRWNSWHFAFWQWIYLQELTGGLNSTLLLSPWVAETHSGSLRTGCAIGVGDGQETLVCCSPWGRKELDMTERLNWTELNCGSDEVNRDIQGGLSNTWTHRWAHSGSCKNSKTT